MAIKIIGVLILLIFYSCYFIKMIIQKRKGIRTDHIGDGKSGLPKFIGITMKIATYITPIVEFISIVLVDAIRIPFFVIISGGCIGSLGVAIFIVSVITMRDSWRAGVSKEEKTELITNGIYKISRNPAFLGFDLVYIGFVLMFFNWILFGVSLFTMIMFHLQIVNVEEDFLLTMFGDEYLKYKKKVCRYLGRKKESNDGRLHDLRKN